MNTENSAQPPTSAPAPVTGLPIDIVAILSALQDQIDELTAHVAEQDAAISRLTARAARWDTRNSGYRNGQDRVSGAGSNGDGDGEGRSEEASGPRPPRA